MTPASDSANGMKDIYSERNFKLSNDGKLSVKGVTLLSQVPNNVIFNDFYSVCNYKSSDALLHLINRVKSMSSRGGFLGFAVEEPSDMHLNSIGRFLDRSFLSIFRFKTWWSTQRVGTSGSDLQMETQWMLLDVPEIGSYVVFLPLIEGSFRSAFQPGKDGHVMVYTESGSTQVKQSSFNAIIYIHVSDNPYNVMKEAYSAVRVNLNTFRLLEEKAPPGLVDKFGWCTWDGFYLTVDPLGVWHGVNQFYEGGIPLRFLVIDDGWQSANLDEDEQNQDAKKLVFPGEQMLARLYRFQERERFRRYKRGLAYTSDIKSYNPAVRSSLMAEALAAKHVLAQLNLGLQSEVADPGEIQKKIDTVRQKISEMLGEDQGSTVNVNYEEKSCDPRDCGMKAFTDDLRAKFDKLDDIYVWQALCGTWGGVRPGTGHLKSEIVPCKSSPGLDGTMEDLAVVKLVEGGIGLVDPQQAAEFYDSMHSYLASVGVTGVKVDVMHALEYVCEDYGGRVELAKRYYDGLSKSLTKNFNGTNLISSMQQCNDFMFLGTKQISIGRVGDDFWFQDPNGDPEGVLWLQGAHMIHCSYNSLWMGQIIFPDWDMFQSDHICAKFHAGSRAICGGPVYVSDLLGHHDFDLLKKLVYPDGTVPICQYFPLPTRDCLFKDPLSDRKTVLKIWNLNKFGGVIGAFNCQGAGWDPKLRRIRGYKECYKTMKGSVHVNDIEWDQKKEAEHMGHADEYVVYLNQADSMLLMTPESGPIHIVLQPSSFELFTFVPIKKLGPSGAKFAPIGLKSMYNSGGTIRELAYEDASVRVKVKGSGDLMAYSSISPKKCLANGEEVHFEWGSHSRLELSVSWNEDGGGISEVLVYF